MFEVSGRDLLSMFLESISKDTCSVFEHFYIVKSHSCLGKAHDSTRFNEQLKVRFFIKLVCFIP